MSVGAVLKKVLRYLKYLMLGLVSFFALFFLFAWLLTIIPTNSDFVETKNGVEVYLVSNGTHVDVCLPKQELAPYLNTSTFELDGPDTRYYSLGWGDKGFYIHTPTWDDLKMSTALYAALWPSPTAMHVTYLYDNPDTSEYVKKVTISNAQLKSMATFIEESFKKDSSGNYQKIKIEKDYYPSVDEFFEANGSYILFYTCNVWTNECIKSAGIKTAIWAPFEWSVMYHFK